jgi:hypothetical protein
MSGQIIDFKPPAHLADRSLEISRSIFSAIVRGEGRDALEVAREFRAEWQDIRAAEWSAAVALAYRVLSKFDQLVRADGDAGGGGGSAA